MERVSSKIVVGKENFASYPFFLHISKHVFILRRWQGKNGKEMS